MKKFLVALTIAFPIFAVNSGNPYTYRLDMSGSSLTAVFPANPQLKSPNNVFFSIDAFNTSSAEIELNCSETVVPSSVTGSIQQHSVSIPASTGYSSSKNANITYPLGKYCWLRSVTGNITSGVVEVVGWSN